MENLEKLQLQVNIIKHGKSFVAYSPALDISTSGKSEAEARKKFQELVQIFFEELEEAGTTEEALFDLGWQKSKKTVAATYDTSRVG